MSQIWYRFWKLGYFQRLVWKIEIHKFYGHLGNNFELWYPIKKKSKNSIKFACLGKNLSWDYIKCFEKIMSKYCPYAFLQHKTPGLTTKVMFFCCCFFVFFIDLFIYLLKILENMSSKHFLILKVNDIYKKVWSPGLSLKIHSFSISQQSREKFG